MQRKSQHSREAVVGLFGGIESGGTKFVCVIGSGPEDIRAETRIPTTTPGETIQKVIDFFRPFTLTGVLSAVGIASFGPLDLDPQSETYGYITTTPKPDWDYTNLMGMIQRQLSLPIAFDTDVNAAAFGEQFWDKEAKLLDPFLYMTVGTGIGIGAIVNGKPLHGLMHAEAGHMCIPHDWQRDPFPGVCPYHGDCLEGLASGIAIKERWGQVPEKLPDGHPAWDLEAEYISAALINLIYAYSPRQIVLGGGVSQQLELMHLVRAKVQQRNNGYVCSSMLAEKLERYIRLPALGNKSGALGAMAMAIQLVAQTIQ